MQHQDIRRRPGRLPAAEERDGMSGPFAHVLIDEPSAGDPHCVHRYVQVKYRAEPAAPGTAIPAVGIFCAECGAAVPGKIEPDGGGRWTVTLDLLGRLGVVPL
jgi:hypothetical protein